MWRNTSLVVRFGPFDGRLALVWVAALLPLEMWKITAAAGITVLFWVIESRGYTLNAAFRKLRRGLAGRKGRALSNMEYRDYA